MSLRPHMTAITGAADRDATVFETALRLRQIALTAIQQSLAEDRLTHATLHRSHRVDATELVPGTSTVEIYRDAAWRGPATLLEESRFNADLNRPECSSFAAESAPDLPGRCM